MWLFLGGVVVGLLIILIPVWALFRMLGGGKGNGRNV